MRTNFQTRQITSAPTLLQIGQTNKRVLRWYGSGERILWLKPLDLQQAKKQISVKIHAFMSDLHDSSGIISLTLYFHFVLIIFCFSYLTTDAVAFMKHRISIEP